MKEQQFIEHQLIDDINSQTLAAIGQCQARIARRPGRWCKHMTTKGGSSKSWKPWWRCRGYPLKKCEKTLL